MSRDWNIVDDAAAPEEAGEDGRLDQRRIQMLTRERRAASRTRQWAMSSAMFGGVAAAICFARAITWFQSGHERYAIGALLAALMLVGLAIRFARRARRLREDARGPAQQTPQFAALSDGSQQRDALRRLADQ